MTPPNRSVETEIARFDEATIARAAALVIQGLPVAVPTETVYGLAADATSDDAVAQIYAAKRRPVFNPLIIHVNDRAMADAIALFDDSARALADAFWPGPLTIVLTARERAVAPLACAGLPTVALRMPAHRAVRALIGASQRPLAAPSANASGAISPTTAGHVAASLAGRIAMIVDDGPTSFGIESTIVATGGELRLLRPGPVTAEMIGEVVGRAPSIAAGAAIEAPGQLASHYAPQKPLRLEAERAQADEWLIGFGAIDGDATLSRTGDLIEAAARLFAALHEADAGPQARIAVAPVPDQGIGAAINDRLRRAAAPRLSP